MIERIIEQRCADLGGGFEVGRVLPFHARRMVGPFVFFDRMGPVDLAPGIPTALDVRPHPHIGLATVTYLFSGAMTHRDSLGTHLEIHPGEVNWMKAGRGITHSERLEYARANGALLHGIQAWVALPEAIEESDPSFSHHEGADLPEWREGGVRARLVAGTLDGLAAAVPTHSPMVYAHLAMEPGAVFAVSAEHRERAVFVADGAVEIAGMPVRTGQMAVLDSGSTVDVRATMAATVMLLGGEPLGPRYLFWNFVSSSRERIEQAKADWQAGRMKLPPGDDLEHIPLPPA